MMTEWDFIDAINRLSERDRALMRAICMSGLTREEIAHRFFMELKTLKNRLTMIYRELQFTVHVSGERQGWVSMDRNKKAARMCYMLGRFDRDQES